MTAVAIALAIAAGLAGAVQAAVMGELGEQLRRGMFFERAEHDGTLGVARCAPFPRPRGRDDRQRPRPIVTSTQKRRGCVVHMLVGIEEKDRVRMARDHIRRANPLHRTT